MVREEGTRPVVVRGDGELRLAVAGDRVDAGACGSMEAGLRTPRDRVKVHQVPEVEGPQERAVARILGARGPPICWPGRRVGVCDNQGCCRVDQGVVWCGVVWCGVVWCGVVWCGVVWCGVVWCGVVWCAEGAVTRRQWPGCLPTGTGKQAGLCVLCARCV